jgi:hypothetical protein
MTCYFQLSTYSIRHPFRLPRLRIAVAPRPFTIHVCTAHTHGESRIAKTPQAVQNTSAPPAARRPQRHLALHHRRSRPLGSLRRGRMCLRALGGVIQTTVASSAGGRLTPRPAGFACSSCAVLGRATPRLPSACRAPARCAVGARAGGEFTGGRDEPARLCRASQARAAGRSRGAPKLEARANVGTAVLASYHLRPFPRVSG